MEAGTESVRIGKRTVDATRKPAKGELRVWDDEIRGFCLRVYASGRKVYAVKYRVGRMQRWYTIGEHGAAWMDGETPTTLTAEIARREATKVKGAALVGNDFQGEKIERRNDLTVAQLIDLYLEEGPVARPAKRASSWTADKACLNHHIRPQIGSRVARRVTRGDITRALKGVRDGTTAKTLKTKPRGKAVVRGGDGIAGRVKAATSAMFNWGAERGLVASNPAARIKLAVRPAKERFLSQIEAAKLLATLTAMVKAKKADAAHADAIRLLLLTGARKSEIVGLRWDEIDFGRTRIELPPERTKAGGKTGERRIPLSPAAMTILAARRPEEAEGLVFPASRGEGATTGLQKTWEAVRLEAELVDLRLHDLRHSYASFAVADGASLALIAKALGHSTTRVTERYAHLSFDPVQALADRTGKRLMGENDKPPAGEDDDDAPPDEGTLRRIAQ
jgi:integrase